MTESAKRKGLAAIAGENFSPMAAMGGVRGIVETIAPSLLFIILFAVTANLPSAIISAVVMSGILLVLRAAQRLDLTPCLGSVIGVAISALWAWRSGEAARYFELGLWTNAAYGAVFLISIVTTWPLIGVLVAFLRSEDQSWRTDPLLHSLRRRYYVATWLWVALFAIRLIVQIPLYRSNNVEVLGIARLVMGPFLFAVIAWLTWMLCRRPGETITLGGARSTRGGVSDDEEPQSSS